MGVEEKKNPENIGKKSAYDSDYSGLTGRILR